MYASPPNFVYGIYLSNNCKMSFTLPFSTKLNLTLLNLILVELTKLDKA
jgi:hypothetical protein